MFNFSYFRHASDTKPKPAKFESIEELGLELQKRCMLPPVDYPETHEQIKNNPSDAKDILDNAKRTVDAINLARYRKGVQTKHVENIEAMSGICCDLDGLTAFELETVMQNIASKGLKFYGFTTWSNGWAKPGICVKLIFPFKDEVIINGQAAVWRSIWSRINEEIFLSKSDRATCDASRLIFLPRVPSIVGNSDGVFQNTSPEYFESTDEAVCVDGNSYLQAAIAAVEENKKELERKKAERKEVNGGKEKFVYNAFLKAICDKLLAAGDGEKHRALVSASFSAGGLIHVLGVDIVRDSLSDVVGHWHTQGRISSIEQARNTVESGITKGRMVPQFLDIKEDNQAIELEGSFDDLNGIKSAVIIEEEKEEEQTELRTDLTAIEVYESIRNLGGFCADYLDDLKTRVNYFQPGYSIASLLSVACTLASRRFSCEGLTTATYICVLGGTGTGKNAPQSYADRVLSTAFPDFVGPSDFASWQATLKRVQQCTDADHGMLSIIDEYGPILKGIFSKHNNQGNTQRVNLLKLATCGTGLVRYAQSLTAAKGEDLVLEAPTFVIYGSSTEKALFDGIDVELAVQDGFIGRHIWLSGEKELPKQCHRPVHGPIPRIIADHINWHREEFRQYQITLIEKEVATCGKNRKPDETEPKIINQYRPIAVQIDEAAKQRFIDFAELCDSVRRSGSSLGNGAIVRAVEQSKKVALALSVLMYGNSAIIDDKIASVSIKVAMLSISVISANLEIAKAENKTNVFGFEQLAKKFESGLIKLRQTKKEEDIDPRDTLRTSRITKKERDSVLIWYLESKQHRKLPPKVLEYAKTILIRNSQ
jgi:hypothetical protein